MSRSSRISGFHKLSVHDRRERLELGQEDRETLDSGGMDWEMADRFSENVLGVLGLPFSVATNFVVNGRDVLVPMSIEEPSVVAAAANAARLARQGGGFEAEADPSVMRAQVEVRDLEDVERARASLVESTDRILEKARSGAPEMESYGGGVRGMEIKDVTLHTGERILVVHLLVDCVDAMGANTVNTMAEACTPVVEEVSGGRVGLRILSNLADRRLARARCRVPLSALESYRGAGDADPQNVRDGVVAAWELAEADPYRAATHNKGIMNGVDALAISTGNDFRALEAGAHAYAARNGRYTALSRWFVGEDGDLAGEIEMPAALGVVGGMTRYHPLCERALSLMDVTKASELAQVMVSLGLAMNMAALLALSTEGIQKGHMRLHARRT